MTKIKNESPILCTLCRLSSEVAKSFKYSLWEAFFFVSFSKMCVFLAVRGLYRCACAFSAAVPGLLIAVVPLVAEHRL